MEVISPEKSQKVQKKKKKEIKTKPDRSNTGILIKKSTMIIQNFRNLEEEYEIHDKLGSGSYGIVKACTHKTTGQN